MPIIDITPAVSARSPVFPGDTAFAATRVWEIDKHCPVNVARIVMSTHAGAHADAPLHYHRDGAAIDAVGLEPYIGPCVVVSATAPEDPPLKSTSSSSTSSSPTSSSPTSSSPTLSKTPLADALAAICDGREIPARVLIKTYARQPETWDPDFTAISAEAINWLAEHNVTLIGVDTPSLDPAKSKTMDAHKAVYENDMRILEGLRLDDAAPGFYELIAPPLKLAGLDAAPVRALLRMQP